MKSGIYRIRNKINGHCYIGSAVVIKKRFNTHKHSLRNKKHHSIYLQRAWDKYGETNFSFEILENVEKQFLIEKEQYYLNELNPEYNICKIAGSCLGVKFSKDSNIKKSVNNYFKGKFGKNNPSSKKVYQYDLSGNFIKEWHSYADIERELGFNSSNIGSVASKNRTAYGYYWSKNYIGEKILDVPKRKCRDSTKKPIQMFSEDWILLKEFDSIKQVRLETKFYIDDALKSGKKSYGYYWKYKKSI